MQGPWMTDYQSDWLTSDESQTVRSLRQWALDADQHPQAITRKLDHQAGGFFNDTLDLPTRCRLMEVYAYGDMAITLALPGLSLTGMMLHLRQSDFSRHCLQAIRQMQCQTFFAVTEHRRGSELNQMKSTIQRSGRHWQLDADKCYVGKAASAPCGIIIARMKGSQSLQPIYISSQMLQDSIKSRQCHRQHLNLHGLRAAQLGEITFSQLTIPNDHLIAWHDEKKKGMMDGSELLHATFNVMRPSVGAMAFGLARAIIDRIEMHYPTLYQQQTWYHQRVLFDRYHMLFHDQVHQLQNDPKNTKLGSRCKMIGHHALTTIVSKLIATIYAEWISDPWLEKWCRDHWGIEFMEGIPAVHYQCELMHTIRNNHRTVNDVI